jgi:Ca2+-binding EF-hand superfamily protein
MTQEELFNSASEDPNGQLTLDQFRVFVMKIAPNLNVKELNMLKTFYDVNRDGQITKQEFVTAGQRGEKAIAIRKRQEEAGEFDADTLENAGQAVLEGSLNSTTSKAVITAEDSKAKIVIQTMEKSGMPFCVFT